MSDDEVQAAGERLHRDWDEARERGDTYLRLAHEAQVQADKARAEALALLATHPGHPDLDWLGNGEPTTSELALQ